MVPGTGYRPSRRRVRLDPDTNVADGIGQRHHPGGHKGNSLLLRGVVLCESMGQHVAGGESDFLSADGDLGRDICGIHAGSRQERAESQCCEDPSKKGHATSTSISCPLLHGET